MQTSFIPSKYKDNLLQIQIVSILNGNFYPSKKIYVMNGLNFVAANEITKVALR